jgi:RNase H-like domain found in reverse transcriptase
MIGPNGLQMDPAKVKVIQDWPEPRKVKDIQSFLGFANFYRQYIHNYSDIVVPSTRLTWKNIPWNFDESCKVAFLTLKQAFISTPVLTHYKPGCPLVIETDASDHALAAILSQVESNGEIHLVTYLSQTFLDTECYDLPADTQRSNQRDVSFFISLVSLERFTVRFILYLPSVSHIVLHPNPSHMSVSTMSMLPLYSVHTQVFETCFTYLPFHLYLFQSFQYLNRSSRVVYSLVNTLYSLT